MLKKIQIVLSSILLVVCLIACSNNNAEVEELKRQVAELKQQNEKTNEESNSNNSSMEAILNEKKDEDDKVDNSAKNILGDLSNLSGEELHKMGRMYLFGDGVEKDYNLSKQCFEMAAEKGYTDSLNNLALMILDGNISGTKEQARQYLETAGANGLAGAYYNLGRFISLEVLEGKVGEALMYLEKAVEMGDENAKKFLEATYNSEITNPDLNSMSAEELLEYPYVYYWQGVTTVAIKYWEAAASKGSVEALRKLGDLYSNYDTVTLEQLIDIEEAKHNYIEAATLGDEHSQKRLEQLGVRYY